MSAIIPKPSGNVLYYKNRAGITTAQIESNNTDNLWLSLSIINTGDNAIDISLNDLRIEVGVNQSFTDDFESFDSVQVEPKTAGQTISYKIVCRG